jgi:hypothetical protein
LINAELDVHEQRLKYYRVQAHLAKARILDRSLSALDDQPQVDDGSDATGQELPDAKRKVSMKGDANAP